MNIVLPMAGRGGRFADKGFTIPKPLIPIMGKPMFAYTLESIKDLYITNLIIIALEEHRVHFNADKIIKQYCPKAEIIYLDKITEGQLCTVLSAKDYIDDERELLILSSDTIVESDLHQHLKYDTHSSGIISVAEMPGEQWSFAKTNEKGAVIRVAEKKRISNLASTGIYYFRYGSQFVNIAEEMICKKEKTKGEYYVIPVYQKLIDEGYLVSVSKAKKMYDLGNPKALQDYIEFRLE